jgi:flagellar protein FliL
MANRLENPKPAEEPAAKTEAAAAPKKGGGSFLPLILNIVLMPAIAYGLTVFVLIPKIQGGKGASHEEAADGGHGGDSHGGGGGSHGKSSKGKVTVPLGGKILVNVSGTAGTRYLVANITLVGKDATLKTKAEENDLQLRDLAMSILGSKTISDVDKPGMRNIIRAELIAAFNDVLGKEMVGDIYFTEFAIQ